MEPEENKLREKPPEHIELDDIARLIEAKRQGKEAVIAILRSIWAKSKKGGA